LFREQKLIVRIMARAGGVKNGEGTASGKAQVAPIPGDEWFFGVIPFAIHLMTLPNHPAGPLGDWFQSHLDWIAGLIAAIGFLVRVWAASGTYLNPDEAMHFTVANQASLKLAYQASLNLSHPPLMICILYFWRGLGTSELLLRFPSIVAGSLFCWIAYKWLGTLLEPVTCLIALVFATFLPSMIALSSEVRQYPLLLVFCAGAGYLLEKALAKNSWLLLALSALSLYLAMLSHYSAFLFAATLSTYTILRMIRQTPSRNVLLTWTIAQLGSVSLAALLYRTHLSKLGKPGIGGLTPGQDFYLRNSYLQSSHMNPLLFACARTGGVFQYFFGQLVLGDLAFLLFLGGVVILWKDAKGRSAPAGEAAFDGKLLAILFTLPFAVTCAAAVAGKYPYGGTRHSAWLIPFAIAGVSLAVVRLFARRPLRAISFGVLIVALCHAFPGHRQPYMVRADQRRARMDQAVKFIRAQIPLSEPIFSDFQSSLLLGHYLCGQTVISYDRSVAGFRGANCHGLRLIATTADTFVFTLPTFMRKWKELVENFGLKPGEKVWIIEEGWNMDMPDELKSLPEFRDLDVRSFGHNIAMFPLTVGRPLPKPEGRLN
jgi:Dolichyl-phosphate-mannose-protein mannosyltransferase